MKKILFFKAALIISILILAAPALTEGHTQKRGTPAQAQAMVPKSSWVVRHQGHIFGCGIHKP